MGADLDQGWITIPPPWTRPRATPPGARRPPKVDHKEAAAEGWYRDLVAKKYDGAQKRGPGRPPQPAKIVGLLLKMAEENPRWGYTRFRGALRNVGFEVGRNGRVVRRERLGGLLNFYDRTAA